MTVNESASSSAPLHTGIIVVHGVADAEQGANLNVLVETMRCNHGIEPEDHDEIYRLPEPSPLPGEPMSRPVIVRRAHTKTGRQITFAEVYWADTTRVSTAKFSALMAAFKVIFEAHYFIDAMLEPNSGKWSLSGIQARLLYLITTLIRGPISGLNIALLVLSAIYIYGQSILQLADTKSQCVTAAIQVDPACSIVPLDVSVLLTMSFLAVYLIYALIRSRRRGNVATFEVLACAAPGVTIGAVLLAIWIYSHHGLETFTPLKAQSYALLVYVPLDWLWRFLGFLIVAAAAVALAISLRTRDTRTRRASWNALALVILQAYLWSILIAVPSIPLMAWGKLVGALPTEIQALTFGFAFNYTGILIIAIAVLTVSAARSRAVHGVKSSAAARTPDELRLDEKRLLRIARRIPRLIIHRCIVMTIIVISVPTTILRLALQFHKIPTNSISINLDVSLFVTMLVTAIALFLYMVLDTKPFVNFVHIARDLIDHQYKPRLSFVYCLLPRTGDVTFEYPRRQRLLLRLKSTVELLERDGCNCFVFVAHSQGSIIVYEYLRSLQGSLKGKQAVVTFGSPLTHLYQHYFHHYANVEQELERLRAYMTSWINLHRVDDPIGNAIVGPPNLIIDIAMGPGGHTNYWPEVAVARAITQSLARCSNGGSDGKTIPAEN